VLLQERQRLLRGRRAEQRHPERGLLPRAGVGESPDPACGQAFADAQGHGHGRDELVGRAKSFCPPLSLADPLLAWPIHRTGLRGSPARERNTAVSRPSVRHVAQSPRARNGSMPCASAPWPWAGPRTASSSSTPTWVGLGHAGIVFGLEASRLARSSTDWHRLLEICALTDTLILDEDGIYDPAHFNDRAAPCKGGALPGASKPASALTWASGYIGQVAHQRNQTSSVQARRAAAVVARSGH
jgi:hypothetical protein